MLISKVNRGGEFIVAELATSIRVCVLEHLLDVELIHALQTFQVAHYRAVHHWSQGSESNSRGESGRSNAPRAHPANKFQ